MRLFEIKRKSRSRVAVLTLIGVLFFSTTAFRYNDVYFEIQRAYSIWSDVFSEVSLRYVDEVEPSYLARVGIDAMLASLDPYTVLIDETANRDIDLLTRGTYAGIGLEVRLKDGRLIVYHVLEGYSAFKAGIQPGDIILEIDGYDLATLSFEDANSLMLGDSGSAVTIQVQHGENGSTKLYELVRERIAVNNISYSGWLNKEEGVAYIHLTRFGTEVARDIRNEIQQFSRDDSLNALILDLRNNPGGLLGEAVNLVDLFVDEGIQVVSTDGRLMEMNARYVTKEAAVFKGPLAILQNESSASASEVVAGALQDLDRAVVYGKSSYGKGLVQIVRPLSYDHSLKMTVSRYLLPSGRSIQSIQYDRGSEGYIQSMDTVRQAFKTTNGRLVRDGKGIDPDLSVEDLEYSPYIRALFRQDVLFEFANKQANNWAKDKVIQRAELLNSFSKELESIEFDFETSLEQLSIELVHHINQDDVLRQEVFEPLEEIISNQKKALVLADQNEVARLLELEMIERLKGMNARKERALQLDPWVLETQQILLDKKRYAEILNVDSDE